MIKNEVLHLSGLVPGPVAMPLMGKEGYGIVAATLWNKGPSSAFKLAQSGLKRC